MYTQWTVHWSRQESKLSTKGSQLGRKNNPHETIKQSNRDQTRIRRKHSPNIWKVRSWKHSPHSVQSDFQDQAETSRKVHKKRQLTDLQDANFTGWCNRLQITWNSDTGQSKLESEYRRDSEFEDFEGGKKRRNANFRERQTLKERQLVCQIWHLIPAAAERVSEGQVERVTAVISFCFIFKSKFDRLAFFLFND